MSLFTSVVDQKVIYLSLDSSTYIITRRSPEDWSSSPTDLGEDFLPRTLRGSYIRHHTFTVDSRVHLRTTPSAQVRLGMSEGFPE